MPQFVINSNVGKKTRAIDSELGKKKPNKTV